MRLSDKLTLRTAVSLVFATCSISVGTTSDTWIIKCILQEPASCFTFSLGQGTAGGEVWTLESLVLFALLCCDQSQQTQDHEEQDSGDHLVLCSVFPVSTMFAESEKEICLTLDHNTSLTGVCLKTGLIWIFWETKKNLCHSTCLQPAQF